MPIPSKDPGLYIQVGPSARISASVGSIPSSATCLTNDNSSVSGTVPRSSTVTTPECTTKTESATSELSLRRHVHRYTISSRTTASQSSGKSLNSETRAKLATQLAVPPNPNSVTISRKRTGSRRASIEIHQFVEARGVPPRPRSTLGVWSAPFGESRPSTSNSSSTSSRSRYPPSSWRDPQSSSVDVPSQARDRPDDHSVSPIVNAKASEVIPFHSIVPGRIYNPKPFLARSQTSKLERTPVMSNVQPIEHKIQNQDLAIQPTVQRSISATKARSITTPSEIRSRRTATSASSSISQASSQSSLAPTPFSSPANSPPPKAMQPQLLGKVNSKIPIRSTVTTAASSSLPPPEEAYARPSYYADCPHLSPPLPRPINIQPTQTRFRAGLLKYPPDSLRPYLRPSTSARTTPPNISILTGSCPNCDLTYRRNQESKVLAKYVECIAELESELEILEQQSSPVSPRLPLDDETSVDERDVTVNIIERQISELEQQRDAEVKLIWRGLSERWGPGAVAIHRNKLGGAGNIDEGDAKSWSTMAASAIRANRNETVDGVIGEGRMRVEWIRPDLPSRRSDRSQQ